ncbi:MAG: L-threonylcarbamoyladenylate synthase [Thermodesulfobacteriota bacterium]
MSALNAPRRATSAGSQAGLSPEQAVSALIQGRCLMYPTETLFAVGGDALDPTVAWRIQALKARPEGKPLPVLVGAFRLLEALTPWTQAQLQPLVEPFWPGPLSVLVPAKPGLPAAIQDAAGWISVRWTSHPDAAWLSRQGGRPVIATSANRSGVPAVGRAEELDPELVAATAGVWPGTHAPAGGAPSTVVRILGPGRLAVVRTGAVSLGSLQAQGWTVQKK